MISSFVQCQVAHSDVFDCLVQQISKIEQLHTQWVELQCRKKEAAVLHRASQSKQLQLEEDEAQLTSLNVSIRVSLKFISGRTIFTFIPF